MKIGIGIDTVGTYTDVVAFDFESKTVLSKGKSLTTKENLSISKNSAVDLLLPVMLAEEVIKTLEVVYFAV